jgi:DNA-directed RNA polymerase specialized sigma24 family protein
MLATLSQADSLCKDASRDFFPSMPSSAATFSAARWLDNGKPLTNNPSQTVCINGVSADDAAQTARLMVLERGLRDGIEPVMHTQALAKQIMSRAKRDYIKRKQITERYKWFLWSERCPKTGDKISPEVAAALKLFVKTLDTTDRFIWGMKLNGASNVTIAKELGISDRAVRKRLANLQPKLLKWMESMERTCNH